MVSRSHLHFNASDRSYMALLKKDIRKFAQDHGFPETRTAVIDIVVAEMTSNLVKHAGGGGEILAAMVEWEGDEALEVICIDSGEGMADTQKMLRDGVSSVKTLGQGLGAIQRLSDDFQLYSLKGWGTILLARFYKEDRTPFRKPPLVETRALVVHKPGERVSGDGYSVRADGDFVYVLLGDGLGHGVHAHAAVLAGIEAFEGITSADPVEIIRHMSVAAKKTRGLVAAVGIYAIREKKWRICGVGNISTRMHYITDHKGYLAYNGIVGMSLPSNMHSGEMTGEKGQLLTMCSDGIKTRWDLSRYPGIGRFDPTILAAALYKDQGRRTDDMSILVSRINKLA